VGPRPWGFTTLRTAACPSATSHAPIVGGKLVARAPSPARWATDERGASGIRRHPSGFLPKTPFGISSGFLRDLLRRHPSRALRRVGWKWSSGLIQFFFHWNGQGPGVVRRRVPLSSYRRPRHNKYPLTVRPRAGRSVTVARKIWKTRKNVGDSQQHMFNWPGWDRGGTEAAPGARWVNRSILSRCKVPP
jgi:hypothetical protein